MKLVLNDGKEIEIDVKDFIGILRRAQEQSKSMQNTFYRVATECDDTNDYKRSNMYYRFADDEHSLQTVIQSLWDLC